MRVIKKYIVGLVLVLAVLIPGLVSAGVKCTGKVTVLAIGPQSGKLQVSTGYGVHYLCQFHKTYNGVDPQICKAWYAMFLAAQSTGKSVSQYYENGAVCSAEYLGNWQVPNVFPYFVRLEDG